MTIAVRAVAEEPQAIPVHHKLVKAPMDVVNPRTILERWRILRVMVLLWLIASARQAMPLVYILTRVRVRDCPLPQSGRGLGGGQLVSSQLDVTFKKWRVWRLKSLLRRLLIA